MVFHHFYVIDAGVFGATTVSLMTLSLMTLNGTEKIAEVIHK
jgi:hypothetical protein